ncbi:30S ribosomal protein S20 [Candidatus Curtissbacteria bacterium]|nr:30S ribosomal protein S20 [Candidatus Curtissbacteria bacterium]
MPVIKQAIKKVRQDRRKAVFNLAVRGKYKKAVLAFRKNPTAALLSAAFRALDRAAKTNVIHRNKSARLKSRLAKKLASPSQKPAVKKS